MTLRQRATDVLRQAIIDSRFPPGHRLVERELCALLGVSRTSVREALRHLESEHLIEMIPHKGPVVAALSVEEARGIYEVRAALEGLAGEHFAERASAEQIEQLCRIAAELGEAAGQAEPRKILATKSRFYQVIFAGARNAACAQMIQVLNSRIWLLRRMSLASPNRTVHMMAEVQSIVDAALARDPAAMRVACIAHVKNACAAAMPALIKAEQDGQAATSSTEIRVKGATTHG